MSKGLEALERLKMFPIYQEIRKMPQQFRDKESINTDLSIIEKELRALEIIKNKYLDPHDFVLCYYTMNNEKWIDYEEYKKAYLNYYENDEYMLTQEEYDLLKEVLL